MTRLWILQLISGCLFGAMLCSCARTAPGSSGSLGPPVWGECVEVDGGASGTGQPSFSQRAVILEAGEAHFVLRNVGTGNLTLNAALTPEPALDLWWSATEGAERTPLDRPLCLPPGGESWIWLTGCERAALALSFDDPAQTRIEVAVFVERDAVAPVRVLD